MSASLHPSPDYIRTCWPPHLAIICENEHKVPYHGKRKNWSSEMWRMRGGVAARIPGRGAPEPRVLFPHPPGRAAAARGAAHQ